MNLVIVSAALQSLHPCTTDWQERSLGRTLCLANASSHAPQRCVFLKLTFLFVAVDLAWLNPSFPRRPGYGTQGKKITLYANYFELKPPEDLLLYRYSVAHLPNIEGDSIAGKKGRWVVKLLLQLHFADSLANIITDYR